MAKILAPRPQPPSHASDQIVNNYIHGGKGGKGGEGKGTGGAGGCGTGPTLNYYVSAGTFTVNNHNNDPSRTVTKVRHRVPLLGEDAIMENLAPVDEARFDHETSADSCLQGTRKIMLDTMFEWIDSPAPGPLIFWLAGLAGTGKTTIAATICEKLDAREAQGGISPGHSHPVIAKLGADFFMSRYSAPRRNPHRIVCTIAYRLADRFPSTRPFLTSALRLNPGIITSKNMERKIMELIIGPLAHAANTLPNCIVIVLDALDECDGYGGEFLPLFARLTSELGGVRVKMVITSRFETDIRSMFSAIGHAAFRLHDIERYIVQADIQHYLEHSFRQVISKRPHVFPPGVEWPSPKDISTLVSRSGTLFIYAATVLKFVGARGHSPERRLEALINSTTKMPTAVGLETLDSLYMEVLRIAVSDVHSDIVDEDLAKRMRHVVGAVVLLQVPVSVQTLSRILDLNPNDVHLALDGVAAMLLIPPRNSNDPIRIFHPSFPDFLLNPERCSDRHFGVHAGMLHSQLTRRCMVIMNTSLQYDMCHLRNPTVRNAEVKDLSERIGHYILPELLYACKFWKAHLEVMTDDSPVLAKEIQSFVSTKLLSWIECLSILFAISVALPALGVAQVWCTHRNMDDEISRLESVRNFVLHEPKVAESALHIYQIAPFHPAFNAQSKVPLPPDLKVRLITAPSQEWSDQPGVFGRHRGDVTCLVISPDGSKLASGSKDTFVRIWDIEMGHCILQNEGHAAAVSSIAFSPDGSQLVTGSEDHSIRVWDGTGFTIVQFVGHSARVNSVVYMINGERVASGSKDGTIRLWSIENGQQESNLDCSAEVFSLSILPDGTLVSGSADNHVRLWDIARKECRKVLCFGSDMTVAATFSPDASRIALRSRTSVGIWNTRTGERGVALKGEYKYYTGSVAFSRDGSFVALGFGDGSISISETSSGRLLDQLGKHTKEVSSVVFSADGRRLFSSSADTTIRVWSLLDSAPSSSRSHQQQHNGAGEGHSSRVLSVAFSPDERWLVSTSGEPEVLVWNTKSGKCVTKLRAFSVHLATLSFHPKYTSPTFACGFNKHVCLWDSQTWKETTKLRGHTGRVNCVRFTHDGRILLSSSEDGTIKLWDSTSKNNTRTLINLPTSPKIFDGFNKLVSQWSRNRVHRVGRLPVESFAPFPTNTQVAAISRGQVFLWDIGHSAPHRLWSPPEHTYSEISCTSSDEGDIVYVTAISTTEVSVLVWNSNGELLDSDRRSPQWKHVRAKNYPNITDESGWLLHTKDARIPRQKLVLIPSDRQNDDPGASTTSPSGRLFAIGGESGLMTILDLSTMVEHLAADAAKTEAVPP